MMRTPDEKTPGEPGVGKLKPGLVRGASHQIAVTQLFYGWIFCGVFWLPVLSEQGLFWLWLCGAF